MKQNIKWIDCLDKSGPDKEGIYFITRETDPPFVEEAAYDPKIGEFVGYDEDDYIRDYNQFLESIKDKRKDR